MTDGYLTCKALVLRETKYKEADRIITLYSEEFGKITAKAQGALRKTSKFGAATQQLTYSDFILLCRKGMVTVKEATIIEEFRGIRTDIESFSLGCYFAECVETLTYEETGEKSILQLVLNSLYALSNNMYSQEHIKSAFELRLMCILGYTPDLSNCYVCKKENPDNPTFGIVSGHISCRQCRNAEIGITDYLCNESLFAMRYITNTSPKSIFSFNISDEAIQRLSKATEDYLRENSEKNFPTLEYWKKIKI